MAHVEGPQSAASLAFPALVVRGWRLGDVRAAGGRRLRCGQEALIVAGGRGGAALRPGAQRMWGAARAQGCAPPRGTREYDRGPQGRSAGGGCRSAGSVAWCARLCVSGGRRGRTQRGGVWGSEIACVSSAVREGGGAEAAGFSVVERCGVVVQLPRSCMSELLFVGGRVLLASEDVVAEIARDEVISYDVAEGGRGGCCDVAFQTCKISKLIFKK